MSQSKDKLKDILGFHIKDKNLFDWSTYDPLMHRENDDDILNEELVAYRDRLNELLKDKGKFVLIKGSQIIGVYENRDGALNEAVKRFRDTPVLVKKIVQKEPVNYLNNF